MASCLPKNHSFSELKPICMNLKVVGSSSKGNGYVLGSKQEYLIIEAGCSLRDVKKVVDFDLNGCVGLIYTHSHL